MSDLPKQSLLLELEDAILKIEAAGWKEEEIFGFVNCILKGFITEGKFSDIYLRYCADIMKQQHREQTQRTVDTPPGIIIAKR